MPAGSLGLLVLFQGQQIFLRNKVAVFDEVFPNRNDALAEKKRDEASKALQEDLNALASLVERQAKAVNVVEGDIVAKAIDRLAELEAGSDQRDAEQVAIEARRASAGAGGNVIEALVDRLTSDADEGAEGRFAGDEAAGERVQELAEGLAGAGQRLSEIDQEIAALNDRFDQNRQDAAANEAEISEIEANSRSQEDLERLIDDVNKSTEFARQVLDDPALASVADDEIGFVEQQVKDGEERLVELERQLENARERGAPADDGGLADFFRDERESLDRKADRLREEREALLAERDAIIGLQGELADLIGNGAPLGDPGQAEAGVGDGKSNKDDDGPDRKAAANVNLDRFLGGGNDGITPNGDDAALNGALPDAVQDVAGNDPLALDQFGFDADQGATEDITGFNAAGGNNGLFPCPPGSTAFPPGFLISNIASCFL